MVSYLLGEIIGRRLPVRSLSVFAILAAIAVGLIVSPHSLRPSGVAAATINSFNCGDTITDNVTLNQNVVCAAGFNAGGGAVLTIGADDLIIDGAGFTFDYSAGASISRGIYGNGFSNLTIKNLTIVGGPETSATVHFTAGGASLLDNTISQGRVIMSGVNPATVDGNTITNSPGTAVWITAVPSDAVYTITDNDLSNSTVSSLTIDSGGSTDTDGLTLTLEGNTFDGSRYGANLGNIKGPFTLSNTNTFASTGYTNGKTLTISGKDVTVDGFSFSGASGSGFGINLNARSQQAVGHGFSRLSDGITISNNIITGFNYGILAGQQQDLTLDGNTITNSPLYGVWITGVPSDAVYTFTDNDLSNSPSSSVLIDGGGRTDTDGLTLTLEGNTFDGSRFGPNLGNIKGPFTLSNTNTFANTGHTGGKALTISGKNLTVDGFSFSGASGSGFGIQLTARSQQAVSHGFTRLSDEITISNNTITGFNYGILTDQQQNLTLHGNTITNSPLYGVWIRSVPSDAVYTITNNDLSNSPQSSVTIDSGGRTDTDGQTLILEGNTFDGSRQGPNLGNIKGPFTLSNTNTFVDTGHTNGKTLTISGKDVTVDGFSFGADTGGIGINVFARSQQAVGHGFTRRSDGITLSNTSVTDFANGIFVGESDNVELDNVTACGNSQGIGIRGNDVDVLGGNVGGNSVEGIHVLNPSTNVVIDGVNFFGNPAGRDVVDDTGGATVQNSTSNPFICPVPGAIPELTIGDASIIEGGDLEFNASLSDTLVVDTIITYSTADGSATTADSDYTGRTNQTITIPAGQTSGTISIPTTPDDNVEPDETMEVNVTGVLATASAVPSGPINWTDWETGDFSSGFVGQGTITTPTSEVNVTYTNPQGIEFFQPSGGTDYYQKSGGGRIPATSPYTSSVVENIPTGSDLIALQFEGSQTLTFSEVIANPIFAYVSLNGNGYGFDQDFEILSFGHPTDGNDCGFFGCGTSVKNVVDLGGGNFEYQLLGTGEPHGTLRFLGAFDSLTWRSLSDERWNGFTVGVQGTAAEVGLDVEILDGTGQGTILNDDAKANTSVVVVSSQNPSFFGTSVTFTATVTVTTPSSATPGGTVDFFDGGLSIGSAPLLLDGGLFKAAVSSADLSVGPHNITATYSGDANFEPSASVAITQVVNVVVPPGFPPEVGETLGGLFQGLGSTIPQGSTDLTDALDAAATALATGDFAAVNAALDAFYVGVESEATSGNLATQQVIDLMTFSGTIETVLGIGGLPFEFNLLLDLNDQVLTPSFAGIIDIVGLQGPTSLVGPLFDIAIAMANGDLAATDAALDAFYAGVEAEATSGNLTLDQAIDLMRLSGIMDTTLARGTVPGPAEAALDATLTPLFQGLGSSIPGGLQGSASLAGPLFDVSQAVANGDIAGVNTALDAFYVGVETEATGGSLTVQQVIDLMTFSSTIETVLGIGGLPFEFNLLLDINDQVLTPSFEGIINIVGLQGPTSLVGPLFDIAVAMANGDLGGTDAALDAFYAGVESEATSGNLTLDDALQLMRLSGIIDTTLVRGSVPGPEEAALDAAITPLFQGIGATIPSGLQGSASLVGPLFDMAQAVANGDIAGVNTALDAFYAGVESQATSGNLTVQQVIDLMTFSGTIETVLGIGGLPFDPVLLEELNTQVLTPSFAGIIDIVGLQGPASLVGPLFDIGVAMANGDLSATDAALDVFYASVEAEATSGNLTLDEAIDLMRLSGTMDTTLAQGTAPGPAEAALDAALTPLFGGIGSTIPSGLQGSTSLVGPLFDMAQAIANGDIPAVNTALDAFYVGVESEATSGNLTVPEVIDLMTFSGTIETVLGIGGLPFEPVLLEELNTQVLTPSFAGIIDIVGLQGPASLVGPLFDIGVAMANGDLAATDAALDVFYAGVEAEATSGNLTLDEAIDLMRLSGTMDTTLARGTAPGPAEAALDAALTPLFEGIGSAIPSRLQGSASLVGPLFDMSQAIANGDIPAVNTPLDAFYVGVESEATSGNLTVQEVIDLMTFSSTIEPVLGTGGLPFDPVLLEELNTQVLTPSFAGIIDIVGLQGPASLVGPLFDIGVAMANGDLAATDAALDAFYAGVEAEATSGNLTLDEAIDLMRLSGTMDTTLARGTAPGPAEAALDAALTPLFRSLGEAVNGGEIMSQ